MTTATDTFRQHLQETQAIHFLPYVGDGYADAMGVILALLIALLSAIQFKVMNGGTTE